MLGQLIAFVMFVMFCMRYVWPPLTEVMRSRQKTISEGLENAAKAEQQLQQANESASNELEAAKREAGELIAQARSRANQIIDEAKVQAKDEAQRIIDGAQDDIDQEISRAREALRERVGELAIEGAEKILATSVDRSAHEAMLTKLSQAL
ncbi:MAG: F0F1 ATP synthase subunit B [Gammaproteobacteria bacterium TMED182]|jgi:F-type H+-transporting ATPase subunit b|nr:F0F1 ATP synthase subunit B [Gammaproteobacteria bacterium]RPG54708.1 MAG: F0F1 ATP synthase subunit B [Gammaproteobacteria bacterium TMED182]